MYNPRVTLVAEKIKVSGDMREKATIGLGWLSFFLFRDSNILSKIF
jgi:hypothetical protein